MQLNLMDFSGLPTREVKKRKRVFYAAAEEQKPQQLVFDLDKFLDEMAEVEWTNELIIGLMDGMLNSALKSIRDKKYHSKSFAEEIAWLYDQTDDSPFSAENCATVSDLDIDKIRFTVSRSLPSEKQEIVRLIDNGAYAS